MATKTETPVFGFEAFSDMFKVPAFDLSAVTEFHKKNVEALAEAGRLAFEGSKSLTQKNVELAKENIAEVNEHATKMFNGKASELGFDKSFETAQAFMQKSVKDARVVADLAVESNQKVIAVLQDRYAAGAEEIKAATAK
ncbi:hypothetical protein GCM10017044_22560 [Kordiimonas sediminis]|uniref:Phasin domain-containing protein n=1 Tax=Kordiimonas sediminis TaxID=1735581 RepID=A0A919AVC2_9PROT|nr:phasin family protein [Kordiimonas sediminis]GHF27007.1 hypothetical protein GCM10017044_22560 [Kordiimonas sediminis]